jgi:hypothetical protein
VFSFRFKKERIVKLLIALIIFMSGACLAQESFRSTVDFFKEEITMVVEDSTASIWGLYYFRNNGDFTGEFPVQFPFYIDSLSLFPDTIKAYMIASGDTTSLWFRRVKDTIVLRIPITNRGVTSWHLDYKQRLRDTRAVYIITSTASWGKPLEDATYRFIALAKYDSVETWPEPDTVIARGDYKEYLTRKSEFMPEKNMEIKWFSEDEQER